MNNNIEYKYLSAMTVISVTFLISAMLFTYRMIEFGPFLTPGGVIPFSATYVIAGIISEVYGYNNARKVIWGNFACIFIFNITMALLLKIPTPAYATNNEAYTIIFNHSLYVMIMYSLGFLSGDLINTFCMSKWRVLMKGKYFIYRLIGSSIIGQIAFSIIVIPMLYSSQSNGSIMFRQFTTTILAKMLMIIILSYPSLIFKKILKHVEIKKPEETEILFNPFSS